MLPKIKHMNVVLVLALIRQESSPVSKGRNKYNKLQFLESARYVAVQTWLCVCAGEGEAYEHKSISSYV